MEIFQKRFAGSGQFFFQPLGAIAISTCPRLRPVFMSATAARMCILHRQSVEIFLPLGTLFGERRIEKTCFTQWASPFESRRAIGISCKYSMPAIDPRP